MASSLIAAYKEHSSEKKRTNMRYGIDEEGSCVRLEKLSRPLARILAIVWNRCSLPADRFFANRSGKAVTFIFGSYVSSTTNGEGIDCVLTVPIIERSLRLIRGMN